MLLLSMSRTAPRRRRPSPRNASEIAAEEVHEVKAEARSSRDFSRELGDFFDGLGPAAYAQEAPPVDDESDDETKTPS